MMRLAEHFREPIRLRRNRDGVAAVEFALLLPFLTVGMMGVLQYSFLAYTYNAMLGAARATTRAVSVGTMTTAQAKAAALQSLPRWVPSASYNFQFVDGAPGQDVMATISAPSSQAAVFSFLPMPANIVASFVMVKQS